MGESVPNHHEDHIAGKGDNSLLLEQLGKINLSHDGQSHDELMSVFQDTLSHRSTTLMITVGAGVQLKTEERMCRSSVLNCRQLQHYNLVHKFIPMPQAMNIPAEKTAMDKECEKLEKISAWNLTKVRSKKQVIDEARTSGAKVHFASLMDICHLKNAELEAKHQKYKGRVVLRGDIVKRRFWVLRSIHRTKSISISNDSRQNHGYHLQITRLRWTSSRRSIGLYPSENGRCSQIIENSKIGVSKHLDSSTTTQMA